ncbi:MAG: hypothetical protein KBG28_09660 [Kofleriaceae bacterium]|nr:hypothetical protein [Kofleriaceae bacterium]MBP6840433.1 hypothetical protein [Kofleriaceae bacterium]MBP9204218.1 hypothetical protein [Kofleriaceae bacterium]
MKRISAVLVLSSGLLAACGGKKEAGGAGAGTGSATGSATGAGSGAGSGSATGSGSAAGAGSGGTGAGSGSAALATDAGGHTGAARWATSLGGGGSDYLRAVALAPDGGAAVAGYFEQPFTAGALGEKSSAGDADAVVVRLGPDGAPRWVQTLGAKRADVGNGVAVGADGAVLLVGNFLDDVTVGDLVGKAAGSDDLFALALDPDGTPRWLATAGGHDSDGGNAVAATPDGGWVMVGSFSGGAEVLGQHFTVVGGTDAWMIKLAKDGQLVWAKAFGGDAADTFNYVTVDQAGNILVAGTFSGKATFGGAELASAGGADTDVVVAKYDPTGAHLWSQRFGNQFNDAPGGVAVDPAGHVAVTGAFQQSIVFGEGEYKSKGEADVFLVRLDPAGKLLWSRTFGSDRGDVGMGVGADAAGNVVVTGWFQGAADFGGGALRNLNGNQDVFVAKYDPTGKVLWAQRVGDKDHDQGRALAVGADGAITLAGVYHFDLALAGVTTLVSVRKPDDRAPPIDMFVARLAR